MVDFRTSHVVYFWFPACFASSQGGHIVKIGRTKNIMARSRELLTASPYPLWKVYCLWSPSVDAAELEREVHSIFSSERMNGEWFKIGTLDFWQIEEDHGIVFPGSVFAQVYYSNPDAPPWLRGPALDHTGRLFRCPESAGGWEMVMTYKPEDVERLVSCAVGLANEVDARGHVGSRDQIIWKTRTLEALAPFRNPKPERVVPPYPKNGDYSGISYREIHFWLSSLEAKIDAIAERVK